MNINTQAYFYEGYRKNMKKIEAITVLNISKK